MEFEEIHRKYPTEFTTALLKHKHLFYEIYEECGQTFTKGCGSYLFDGQNYTYCNLMYEKQELLYHSVKNAKHVLEIGTYMGHSLLIMLLANPSLKITCIDISDEFTLPAVKVLNRHFHDAIQFIHGDSLSALMKMEKTFDFFHIDGHHNYEYIKSEFNMISNLNHSKDRILRIIFDDQECLLPLQKEIHMKYKVIQKIIPNCPWNNLYLEIQL